MAVSSAVKLSPPGISAFVDRRRGLGVQRSSNYLGLPLILTFPIFNIYYSGFSYDCYSLRIVFNRSYKDVSAIYNAYRF